MAVMSAENQSATFAGTPIPFFLRGNLGLEKVVRLGAYDSII
jgi:hypothetical protein